MNMRILMLGVCFAFPVLAAPSPADFHRAVYALHERQIARHSHRVEERAGDYEGSAAAGYRYRESTYIDTVTGRRLSRIERNADNADAIHSAEVSVFGDDGRLARGYISISLPWAPLTPVRTWINLHHYNGRLHSFRQFDLSGDVNYEFCEGELDGKHVRISLDGSDIGPATTGNAAYRACFEGLRNDWQAYANPR